METRQERGFEIAKQKQVKPNGNGWTVQSQSGHGVYHVGEDFDCDCPDCQTRQTTCKHAFAVRYYLQVEKETPKGLEVERVRLSYPQAWKAYNAAQTEEIHLFDELLKDLVAGIDEPEQETGRPRLPLREQAFCAIQKVYSQLSSRRAASLYFNAKERKQITKAPNFNAINKFLNHAEITPILERLVAVSAAPLKAVETEFAVDSTGFTTSQFGAYCNDKYQMHRKHEFVKAHACVGVKTNIVASVAVTDCNGADITQFPALVANTAKGFTIEEVSADKAYSSRDNLEFVADFGGKAYIPFKKNATGKMGGSMAWKKLYHLFSLHADEFYEHYHKRSNVESTFAAIKKKFGEKLKNKNPVSQKNELLCKIIAYNLTVVIHEMKEIGVTPNFRESSLGS